MQKKKVRIKILVLCLTKCIIVYVCFVIEVSIWRGSPICNKTSSAKQTSVIVERFPDPMYNQRNLSEGTGSSPKSTKRKKWYSYPVFKKRHIVSVTRTHDMEIT